MGRNPIHGMYDTKTYKTWSNMKVRCKGLNVSERCKKVYEKIDICKEWNDFNNFYRDMGEKPEGKTLERIDSNKGYTPDNCKWVSWKDQNKNTNRNRWLSFKGKKKILAEWARTLGIKENTLLYRLKNWPKEIALTRERFEDYKYSRPKYIW